MSKAPMARADFFTSIFFFVLGTYMAFVGLGMPGAGPIIEPGGEPGRVPVMLGCIIALCAAVLLIRSVGQGGHRTQSVGEVDAKDGDSSQTGWRRCLFTALGCSFYAVGLVGSSWFGWQVPYHLATGLFLFLFIIGFEWGFAVELGGKRWVWLEAKFPQIAGFLTKRLSFVSRETAPYAWLIATAFVQAILVTWAVTHLFEKQFYVTLP